MQSPLVKNILAALAGYVVLFVTLLVAFSSLSSLDLPPEPPDSMLILRLRQRRELRRCRSIEPALFDRFPAGKA